MKVICDRVSQCKEPSCPHYEQHEPRGYCDEHLAECDNTRVTCVRVKNRVVIECRGGVVQAVSADRPDELTVILLDWDETEILDESNELLTEQLEVCKADDV